MSIWHSTTTVSVALLLGCSRGPNDERAWSISETRVTFNSPDEIPQDTSDLGDLQVYVPLGVPRYAIALAARDSLVVGTDARVIEWDSEEKRYAYATVSSMGSLDIGRGARLGSVYAYGKSSLRIGPEVRIDGYVKSAGRLDGTRWVWIKLGGLGHVRSQLESFYWYVNPPAKNRGVRVSRAGDAQTLGLEPGSYSRLTIEENANARIHAGQYYFESLQVDAGGTLEIDNMTGPVYVWVRDSFELRGIMRDFTIEPNILVGYVGSQPATIRTAFRGTLVAPNSEIALPAAREPHSGSFFGRSIVVAPEAVVELRGFLIDVMDPPDSAAVCNNCAQRARRAALDCCTIRKIRDMESQGEMTHCMAACAAGAPIQLDTCESMCAVNSTEELSNAWVAAVSCLEGLWNGYAQCLLQYGYRDTTCLRTGYLGVGNVACASR